MKHVLFVDENEDHIGKLRETFRGNGYTVDWARHGAEALRFALDKAPDMIVSSLQIPLMDGFTLLRRCKTDPRLQKIKFVFYIEPEVDPADAQLVLKLGAEAVIPHLTEPSDLAAKIAQVLESPKPAAPMHPEVALNPDAESLVRKLEEKSMQLEIANAQLLREQTELRMRDRALQCISQGIVITDVSRPDNPIVFASSSFERLSGYENAEIVGRNCRFLQGKETDAATITEIRKSLEDKQPCSVELLNYRKDGQSFWNHLAISPVTDASGKVSHFVGVQTDVTERRRLEAELRQSQKLEAIGSLAGGVAHDFNNLLAAIGLNTEMLLDGMVESDPLRKGLESILAVQERGAGLTRQLLAFSRKDNVALEAVDLDVTVKGLASMLRRLIGERIQLEAIYGPGSKIILADVGHIEQIVMNLVINSRDSIEGVGKILIETVGPDQARGESSVSLTVKDSGCGMDEATKLRIFEPFYTTKDQGKGTGLGLSTVHGLVTQLKGSIEVKSSLGEGTEIRVSIPEFSGSAKRAIKESRQTSKKAQGQNILIVEDQVELREVLMETLRAAGYSVTGAEDGVQALAIFSTGGIQFKLVVTDVVMPKMGGRELSEKLATLDPQVEMLFLSGYTEDELLKHGISGRSPRFLDKPFSSKVLLKKIQDILNSPDGGKI